MFIVFVLVCFVAVFFAKWCAGKCSKNCQKAPPRRLPQPGSVLTNMSFENHPVDGKRAIRMQLLEDNDGDTTGATLGEEEVYSRRNKKADHVV